MGDRLAVARAFHEASPIGREPFLALDCAREEARLWQALHVWLDHGGADSGGNPLIGCGPGTLYLDEVACLSAATQRLLLVFARSLAGRAAGTGPAGGPTRLAAGGSADLAEAVAERRFSRDLYDGLDKIRVQLGRPRRRGAA